MIIAYLVLGMCYQVFKKQSQKLVITVCLHKKECMVIILALN